MGWLIGLLILAGLANCSRRKSKRVLPHKHYRERELRKQRHEVASSRLLVNFDNRVNDISYSQEWTDFEAIKNTKQKTRKMREMEEEKQPRQIEAKHSEKSHTRQDYHKKRNAFEDSGLFEASFCKRNPSRIKSHDWSNHPNRPSSKTCSRQYHPASNAKHFAYIEYQGTPNLALAEKESHTVPIIESLSVD